MANGKEVYHLFDNVEGLDNPIVTDAQPVARAGGKTMMGKRSQSEPHLVNSGLDSCLNCRRKFKECCVELGVIYLKGRAHCRSQGFRTRGRGLRPSLVPILGLPLRIQA